MSYEYDAILLDMLGDVNGLMRQASQDYGALGWAIVGTGFIPNATVVMPEHPEPLASKLILLLILQREVRAPQAVAPWPLCKMGLHAPPVNATWAIRPTNQPEWAPCCEACMRQAPDDYRRMRLRRPPSVEEPS